MKRGFHRWASFNTLKYIIYFPVIIKKIKNWPAFMLNYLGLTNGGNKYIFRNGIEIFDREGSLTGIIAVVFIRENYGKIENPSVIVDIGANIGVFSIYAAAEAKNAIIYAFEPVQSNYDLLLQNIKNNALSDRIKTFKLGIASKAGTRKIRLSSCTMHSMVDDGTNQKTDNIDCITLADIIKKNRLSKIDLLKMNCEGAEYEILYSTGIDCFEKISDIRLEYHNIDTDQKNANHLESFLASMGYCTTKIWTISKEDGFLWMRR